MTASSSAAVPGTSATRCWAWPIDETRYDRRITLPEPEVETLRGLGGGLLAQARGVGSGLDAAPWRSIRRLVRPLRDAQVALHWDHDAARGCRYAWDAAGLVLIRCGDLQRSFWGWREQDWIDLIDPAVRTSGGHGLARSAPTPAPTSWLMPTCSPGSPRSTASAASSGRARPGGSSAANRWMTLSGRSARCWPAGVTAPANRT